jgi:hypothetical protein
MISAPPNQESPMPPRSLAACSLATLAFGCVNVTHIAEPRAPAPPAPAGERIERLAIASPVKPKVTRLGETPSSAIFIGNSFFYYNNSLHNHVGQLVRSANPKVVERFRSTSATISGSGIDWHDVDAYFKPAVAAYSFDAKNHVVFNKLDRKFDVAIVQDCSQCPVNPQLKAVFHEFTKKNAQALRKHRATPVFFMTWAYEDVPSMTADLAAEYTTAGNANDALVIPAGLAFAKALYKRPGLRLYVNDKRHPTLAGSYLAACTVFASLYGLTPEGNKYIADLDPSLAAFLQGVAWETVREYYGN